MTSPASFYVRERDGLRATELTRGPWSNAHQHGGPPCALLAGAVERFGEDAARFVVARLTIDYLKPVPIGLLQVEVEPLKLGGKAQRFTARLLHEGSELLRATVLRLRRGELQAPPAADEAWPGPESVANTVFSFFQHPTGYHSAMELRFVRGAWGEQRVRVWMRALVPLVLGEPTSPLERVVTVVDAQSGVCPPLDVRRHTFVNPDLTLALHREPTGEWVGLEASSTATSVGLGLAQSEVRDLSGVVGRGVQTLLVEAR